MSGKGLTEEDIRPQELMEQKKAALEADRLFLISQKNRWQKTACPVCGEAYQLDYGEKDECRFVRCPICSLVYTSPRPSKELLHEYYAQSQNYAMWNKLIFPATAKIRYDNIYVPRAQQLLEHCVVNKLSAGGSFLEIGAGHGGFCEAVKELDFFNTITAIEPTAHLAQTCREKGLEVVESTLEEYQTDKKYDVVVAYEVIEHLHDPGLFIKRCAGLLATNGLLFLSFPNIDGFDVRVLGVTASSFQYGHLNYFSPPSISHLLFKYGFTHFTFNTPGKLDADMVKKRMNQADSTRDFPFLGTFFEQADENAIFSFQQMIQALKLSSHMVVIASQPN